MTPTMNAKFQKCTFTPGDTIKGDLYLTLTDPFEISGIYLQLQGYERVRFRQRNDGRSNTNSSSGLNSNESTIVDWDSFNGKTINTGIPTILPISQPNFSQSVILASTVPVSRHRARLQSGTHIYPISVNLPSGLPPSLNFCSGSKYQATIEYIVTFQVFPFTTSHRKMSKSSALSSSFPVVIIPAPCLIPCPLNFFLEKRISVGHAACCGILQKQFDFKATWARNTFSPGDTVDITIKLALISGRGTCTLRMVSVKLVRELILMVDDQMFRTVDPIEKAKFKIEGALLSGEIDLELCTSAALTIPANLEQKCSATSSSIHCRYFLVFEVDFRWYKSVLLAAELLINPV